MAKTGLRYIRDVYQKSRWSFGRLLNALLTVSGLRLRHEWFDLVWDGHQV